MNNFLTWDTLKTYTSFVAVVFMVVEFTKDVWIIKKIPTRYWSFLVSLGLLIATNLAVGTFDWKDLLLYALSSISISLGSNGLSDFSNKGDKEGK